LGLTLTLRGELIDPGMEISYNRNAGLALHMDLALLCRRGAHRLLMIALKSKCKAHKHALKLRRRVAQIRVGRETQSYSDSHLKWNAELLRPTFEPFDVRFAFSFKCDLCVEVKSVTEDLSLKIF